MKSVNSKWLQQALAPSLKLRGFKKSGATWRKEGGDGIAVLNLQGSQWGAFFYVNLGVYFQALGDSHNPCEYDCHVRERLTELVPDRKRLNELLDFENPVQDSVRLRELEALVIEYGLPWLATVSTLNGAREFCRSQSPKSPLITKEARTLLGLAHGA